MRPRPRITTHIDPDPIGEMVDTITAWQAAILEAATRGERIIVLQHRHHGRDEVMRVWAEAVLGAHHSDRAVDSYYDEQPDDRTTDEGAGMTIDELLDDIDAALEDHRSNQ